MSCKDNQRRRSRNEECITYRFSQQVVLVDTQYCDRGGVVPPAAFGSYGVDCGADPGLAISECLLSHTREVLPVFSGEELCLIGEVPIDSNVQVTVHC
jgi:hypothetical protein